MRQAYALMTEAELQINIVREAKALGWLVTFTWRSIHSPYGEADLRMVKVQDHMPSRCLMVECKSEKGKLTEAQREFLRAWATVQGCEAYVVRPSTLESFYQLLLGQASDAEKEIMKP